MLDELGQKSEGDVTIENHVPHIHQHKSADRA